MYYKFYLSVFRPRRRKKSVDNSCHFWIILSFISSWKYLMKGQPNIYGVGISYPWSHNRECLLLMSLMGPRGSSPAMLLLVWQFHIEVGSPSNTLNPGHICNYCLPCNDLYIGRLLQWIREKTCACSYW